MNRSIFPAADVRPHAKRILPAGLAFLGAGLMLLLAGCDAEGPPSVAGYVEIEGVNVASPLGGVLSSVAVTEGQDIKAGAPLFTLEAARETAAVDQAQREAVRAEHQVANLKTGLRPDELDALEARLRQAESARVLAEKNYQRAIELGKSKMVSPAYVDEHRTAVESAIGKVEEAKANLKTGHLGARVQELRSAQATLGAAQAALRQALWAVDQKSVHAPRAGTVQELLYRPGEYVPPGHPVLVLVPQESYKARFFLGTSDLPRVAVGSAVNVQVDGCKTTLPARVKRISTEPEYAPPVLFSRDSRDKLVYLVDAWVHSRSDCRLHPGAPLSVSLLR